MPKINIELTEEDVTRLVYDYLNEILGVEIDKSKVIIEVKSTQNFKSEWEKANFRVRYQQFS